MRVTSTLFVVLLVGCSQPQTADIPAPHVDSRGAPCRAPRLSETSAVRIALADLERRKYETRDWEAPRATCFANSHGGVWSVYFQTKNTDDVEGCLWVLIDDRTGKVDPRYVVCG
jgi:hypothetical protein